VCLWNAVAGMLWTTLPTVSTSRTKISISLDPYKNHLTCKQFVTDAYV